MVVSIALTGPSTTPGAPQNSPLIVNTAINAALAQLVPLSLLGTDIGDVLGPLINMDGSGFPGLKTSSRLIFQRLTPAFNDFVDLQVNRTTTFTGGLHSNINAGFRVIGSYGANDATQNWNAVFQATTFGTLGGLAQGSYSVAFRGVGGTDGVWGSISNATDLTGLASTSGKQVVGQEVDVQVNKADNGVNGAAFGGFGVRYGLNIVGVRWNSADTAQTEITSGLWFTTATLPLTGASDTLTNFKSAIGFGVGTQTQSALDTRGAIPPAGSANPVNAVTMSAGHVIDFSGGAALNSAPGRSLTYNSGGTKLQYLNVASELFSVSDAGNALVAGTLGVTGAATLSAGATLGGNAFAGVPLVINGVVAAPRQARWQTAGVTRWALGMSSDTEPGANLGANLSFSAFSDAGANIGTPFALSRATGLLTLTPISPATTALQTLGSIISLGQISVTGPGGGLVLSGSSGAWQHNLTFNMLGAYTGSDGILNITNSTDTAALTPAAGSIGYPSLNVSRQFGGAGVNGGRSAAVFNLNQTQAATNNTGGQYITLMSQFVSSANAGGTGLTGALTGGNGYAFYPQAILKPGATNYNIISLSEGDIGIVPTTQQLTVGGVVAAGDVITATFTGATIAGSPLAVTYTAGTGNLATHIVNGLMAAIMFNPALQAAGVSAIQNTGTSTILNIVWRTQDTVSVALTTSGTETLALGAVVPGASAKLRKGITIAHAGNDGAQGVQDDFALEFGPDINSAATSGQWRNTVMFDPVTSFDGTLIGARDQVIFAVGAVSAPFHRLASKYGIDLSLVNFSIAGGASLRMPGFQVDGAGILSLKNATLTTDTTGLTIDVVGRVGSGNPAIVAGGGGGSGILQFNYFVGDIVKDANGGQYLVATVNASTGAVTALTTLVQPSTSTASLGTGIATTGGSGTGLTITPTAVANTALALLPTAGGKLAFNGATPIIKPTGVAVTAAGIHAALTSLGLIAP